MQFLVAKFTSILAGNERTCPGFFGQEWEILSRAISYPTHLILAS